MVRKILPVRAARPTGRAQSSLAETANEKPNPWTDSEQAQSWKPVGDFFSGLFESLGKKPETFAGRVAEAANPFGPLPSSEAALDVGRDVERAFTPQSEAGNDFFEAMGQQQINQGAAGTIGPARAILTSEAEQQSAASRDMSPGAGGSSGTPVVRVISDADYEMLSPEQRRAVDVNTELFAAIQSDQDGFDNSSEASNDEYVARVDELFGEGGRSDRYAPNTVAALEALGLANPERGDLDNYLSLHGLVTQQDLDLLGDPEALAEAQGSEDLRALNAIQFSSVTSESMANALSRGTSLLASLRYDSGEAAPTLGFGARPIDAEAEKFFKLLATDQMDDATFAEAVQWFEQENGVTQDELAGFFDARLRALEYSTEAGKPIVEGSIPAAEFRSRWLSGG